jgi:hypothetical protein
MSYFSTVAIIDDGVSNCFAHKLAFNLIVGVSGEVTEYIYDGKNKYGHGTICFLLLKKHLPSARIGSIAMEDFTLKSLNSALQWCLSNNINYIQLSIGVVQPSYSEELKLRDIIEKLFLNGCIIVASVSNSNQYTVPACLPHVFGVRSKMSNSPKITSLDKSLLGINFEASEKSEIGIDNRNVPYDSRSNSYAVPKVMASLVKTSDLSLREYQKKQFELVYPYTSKDYIYIGRNIDTKPLLPSMINVIKYTTPKTIPKQTSFDHIVIGKDFSTDVLEILKLLVYFKPKYCIFLDSISQSIRDVCISKRIFYWDPRNYFDVLHNYFLTESKALPKNIYPTCPIIYISSTYNPLSFSNSFYNHILAKGYFCRFISIEKDYFMPGYDYCPDLTNITSLVNMIFHVYCPSIIFILGSQEILRANESLGDIIDIEINIDEDSSFSKSDFENYMTLSVPPHSNALGLVKFFNYVLKVFTH